MCAPAESLHHRSDHDVGRRNEKEKKDGHFYPEQSLLNPAGQRSTVDDEDANTIESMVQHPRQQRDLAHHERGLRVQFYPLVIHARPPAEKHGVDNVSQQKEQDSNSTYAVEV